MIFKQLLIFTISSLTLMVLVTSLGFPNLRIPLIIGLISFFFILNKKQLRIDAVVLSLLFLFVYFVIQALLIQQNIDSITFYQSLVMITLYIVFYWFVNANEVFEFARIKYLSLSLFYFFFLLFIPLDKELGRFSGLYGNPNGTSHTAMFLLPLILLGINKKRKIFIILLLFLLIYLTASRSTLLSLGIASAVFYIVNKWHKKINFINATILMCLVVLTSWYAINFVEYITNILVIFLDKDNHLLYMGSNGRDEIWILAKERFIQNPILGSGFDSAKFIIDNDYILGTHNSYLEILLKGGVIGLTLVIIFLLTLIKKMVNSNSITKPYVFMGLAIVLSLSTNSSVLLVFNFYFYYFLILFGISQAKLYKSDHD